MTETFLAEHPVRRSFPASSGQQALWLFEQLTPGTAACHLPLKWELRGPLNVGALTSALSGAVERHDTLRTVLRQGPGSLEQLVRDPRPVELERTDLRETPVARRADMAARLVTEFVRRPFALDRDQPVRALLLRRGEERWQLVLNFHHVAVDGVSLAVLKDEIRASYEALERGRRPALGEPPAAYARRAAGTDSGPTGSDNTENSRAAMMHSRAEATLLPGDRPRPARPSGNGGVVRTALPPHAVRTLAERAGQQRVTPFMAFLAVFGILLGRWCDEPSVVVSTPFDRRELPEQERTVGFFADALPIVLDARHTDLGHLLEHTRGSVLSSLGEWDDSTDRQLAKVLRATRVSFALDHVGPRSFSMGRVRVHERFLHTGTSRFDLAVRLEYGEHGCHVLYEYDSAVFDRSTILRLAHHYAELVEAAALAGPGEPVSWPAAPRPDRAAQRRLGHGDRRPVGPTVCESIARQAVRTPDAVALRLRGRTMTYQEMWHAAGHTARALARHDLAPGDLVAVSLPRLFDLVVVILGILRLGAGFVPLDPADPPARGAGVLSRAGVRVLVTNDREGSGLRRAGWDGLVVDAGTLRAEGDAPPPAELPGDRPAPSAIAYVIHTSGSTGTPKGVAVPHSGLANYVNWAVDEYGLGPGRQAPLYTSVAFDLALTSLLGPLVGGGTVRLVPDGDTGAALDCSGGPADHLVKATPTRLDMLTAREEDLSAASVVVLGGENLMMEQVRRHRGALPYARIVNEYGPTETVVGSVAWSATRLSGEAEGHAPIGLPIANTTAYVVDGQLRPLPVGVWGHLVLGGEGVAQGYRNRPAATADRFLPDPFTGRPGARLYHTGDVARWTAAGLLEVRGRVDDQVKIHGYRVEPGEIEEVLRDAPGVLQAAVRVEPADPPVITGFIRLGRDAGDDALHPVWRWLHDRLPRHLTPDTLVPLPAFPLTPSGKLDRAALPPAAAAPAPRAGKGDPHAAAVRQAVTQAWSQALGIEHVDTERNFFDAGGTSLLLLKLHRLLVTRGLGTLTPADLFRFTTVSSLVGHLTGGEPVPNAPDAQQETRAQLLRARRQRAKERRTQQKDERKVMGDA